MADPRCVAPVGPQRPAAEERLCGAPAVNTRVVEGIACPLCAAHAVEADADLAEAAGEADRSSSEREAVASLETFLDVLMDAERRSAAPEDEDAWDAAPPPWLVRHGIQS